jgi:predicted small secreted protein
MFYFKQTILIMKKILLVVFMAVLLAACGTAYNNQLK